MATLVNTIRSGDAHLEIWECDSGKFAFVEYYVLISILDFIPNKIEFVEDNHWEMNWGGSWVYTTEQGEWDVMPGATEADAIWVSNQIGSTLDF